MRGLKVLFVIDSLGGGGAEQSLAELVPRLAAGGVEPRVVTLRPVPADGHAVDFDVRTVTATTRIARIQELRRLLLDDHPDIVHTTLFDADVTGRVAGWRTGAAMLTSLVNTTYDPVRLEDPNIRRFRLYGAQVLDGWTARHLTDHFHAITHAVKDAAVRALRIPPERVTVIERGRDDVRLGEPGPDRRHRARQRLALGTDARVVVSVGRQDFQKGHRYLVDAFASVAAARPDAVLLLVGKDGTATSQLEQQLRSLGDVREQIRVLGHRNDVPELLAAADVFAFPSLYEGLGGATIEAMALGLPVVASDLPALREVIEHERTGLLVPACDPPRLAEAIADLLDDPDRARRFGGQGRDRFARRFTLTRSVERMLGLYSAVHADRSFTRGQAVG